MRAFFSHRILLPVALGLCLGLGPGSLRASDTVTEVSAIRITVGDMDRALAFYTGVLPFRQVALRAERAQRPAEPGATVQVRIATLELGQEQVELVDWPDPGGRPIPADSRSFDRWFQHIAIVVSDMDRAYAHLRQHRVKHVSPSPQTLPDWNPNAGGIRAFYFRDPEDHVLELIWFPEGKGDPRWRRADARSRGSSGPAGVAPGEALFLGIDHTAIAVEDTERSLGFYRDRLGLRIAGTSENHGIEQERLNQVFGARLRITALRAGRGPGIEFLEYIAPPGGRPIPADRRPDDLSYWMVVLRTEGRAEADARVTADPDGHALVLVGAGGPGDDRGLGRAAGTGHAPP